MDLSPFVICAAALCFAYLCYVLHRATHDDLQRDIGDLKNLIKYVELLPAIEEYASLNNAKSFSRHGSFVFFTINARSFEQVEIRDVVNRVKIAQQAVEKSCPKTCKKRK